MRLLLWIPVLILSFLLGNCAGEERVPTVALQTFGDVPVTYLDSISACIEAQYGFRTERLGNVPLPEAAFTNVKSPRYRADTLLRFLNSIKPASCTYILGITTMDISCTKRDAHGDPLKPESRYSDWGVFGLGQHPGSACVISSFRLPKARTEYYLAKVALHELGHNFGLPHCEADERCVMRDAAEKLSTLDEVSNSLCAHCQATVKK